jgi:hypothetical protein
VEGRGEERVDEGASKESWRKELGEEGRRGRETVSS